MELLREEKVTVQILKKEKSFTLETSFFQETLSLIDVEKI